MGTVEEVPLGAPYLKAGGTYLGKYCEPQNNEFMLCRLETNDPSKCLADGRAVTNCTNEFFRKTQAAFDACMKQNLNMDRPHYAYHTMAKIHDTTRPRPVEERPKWLDDPRGAYGRPDVLPKDFPRGVGESGGMRIQ